MLRCSLALALLGIGLLGRAWGFHDALVGCCGLAIGFLAGSLSADDLS